MPKRTLKEIERDRKQLERYNRGYKDFWALAAIVLGVWLLEAPAVIGLVLSQSRSHFNTYGTFMLIASVVGFGATVLLLALDKRKASIIVSIISFAVIVLVCVLVYKGYESAISTSGNHVQQIIASYVSPIVVPIATIIMVKRRI